jgi:pilus assembly protein Flp/PilA
VPSFMPILPKTADVKARPAMLVGTGIRRSVKRARGISAEAQLSRFASQSGATARAGGEGAIGVPVKIDHALNRKFSVFVNAPATNPTYIRPDRTGKNRWEAPTGVLMRQLISKFVSDETGATAIEYCIIAAGISIVIVTAVNGIGGVLSGKFVAVSTSLK